ncbi:MAG: cysteine hydrolase [Clostridia bacterium]|nr:cysteine hydrolase [Clostridia bacterium]
MERVLIVVDMQVDFVSGALGTKEAEAIVSRVAEKVRTFEGRVIFTRDTHTEAYPDTQEGRCLPVAHCVRGTEGWQLVPDLRGLAEGREVFDKPAFGSVALARALAAQAASIGSIELIGLCTDICVVSNALLLKAFLPEVPLFVDSACCAGVTPEKHLAALETMRSCQIRVI